MKRAIYFISILFVLVGLLVLACEEQKDTEFDGEVPLLSFSPAGVWIDLSDGEPVFNIFSDGTFDYGAKDDYGVEKLGKWTVVDDNEINLDMEEINYNVSLKPNYLDSGYNVIENTRFTLCLIDDYNHLIEIKDFKKE